MIKLEKYDEKNIDNLKFLKKIVEDEEITNSVNIVQHPDSENLCDFYYIIKNDDVGIGMVCINCPFMGTKELANVNAGILKEYRNKGYSKGLLEEIYNMMLTEEQYSSVKDILLFTSYKNKAGISSALKAGFVENLKYKEAAIEEGVYTEDYFYTKRVEREKVR